ncbi:MAG: hypothetical protein V1838_01195 [Patescibacteria group bacterium]
MNTKKPGFTKEQWTAMDPNKHEILDGSGRVWTIMRPVSQRGGQPTFLLQLQVPGYVPERFTYTRDQVIVDEEWGVDVDLNHPDCIIRNIS